jgi:hypothetical protein
MLSTNIIKISLFFRDNKQLVLEFLGSQHFSAKLIIFSENSGRIFIAALKSLFFGEWNIDGLMQ